MNPIQDWRRLVGRWTITGTHPLMPGEQIRGSAIVEWLDDQQCMSQRTFYDHRRIPDALMITSVIDGVPTMFYFDNRGVYREYGVEITSEAWRFWNDVPGLAQRWDATFGADGKEISGRIEICRDGSTWEPDLDVTYRRR